jgi:short chain dehydrogenase
MSNTAWLITGASSGPGYALAEYVLQQGDRVVLAARRLDSMAGLAKRFPETGLALTLDVTKAVERVGRAWFLPHGHRTAHQVFMGSHRCICRDLRRFPGDDERTAPRSFSGPADRYEARHATRGIRRRQRYSVQHRLSGQ